MLNVREYLEQLITDAVIESKYLNDIDHLCPFVEMVDVEGDEYLRYEVLVDDGNEDFLVVAHGTVDHEFNLTFSTL
jgi:hypothetical protein